MREPLLFDRGLMALTFGGFGRLDAHTRFTLGTETGLFDLALVIALSLDFRFFCFASLTFGFLLRTNACLFGTTDRVFLFLDAVLLDLTELAKREQN